MKRDEFLKEAGLILKILDHHHQELMEALELARSLFTAFSEGKKSVDDLEALSMMFEVVETEGKAIFAEAHEGWLDVKRFMVSSQAKPVKVMQTEKGKYL